MKSVLRVIVVLTVFLLGGAFAGYTNVYVKQVLTDFDRVVLMSVFLIGNLSIARWIADLNFWSLGDEDVIE